MVSRQFSKCRPANWQNFDRLELLSKQILKAT